MFPCLAGCAHKEIASHDTLSSMVHSFLVENVWPLKRMKSVTIAFHWFENAEEVWQTMSHSWLKSSGCLLFSILGPNGLLQSFPSPSLCLLLDFLGSLAPQLCSSALGLMPLSAVHRLEDALRAAHHILGSSFAPPDLSIPSHLLRVQDLLNFSSRPISSSARCFHVCPRVFGDGHFGLFLVANMGGHLEPCQDYVVHHDDRSTRSAAGFGRASG